MAEKACFHAMLFVFLIDLIQNGTFNCLKYGFLNSENHDKSSLFFSYIFGIENGIKIIFVSK